MPALRARHFCLLVLAAVACQPAAPAWEELPPEFRDTSDETSALGVTCVGSEPCSGEGDVYTSAYRVGTTATTRSELLQTFVATADGAPSRVSLVLRHLRAWTSSAEPQIHVEIFPVADPASPLVTGTPLLSGTKALAQVGAGVTTIALAGTGTLQANATYALVVRTDGVEGTGTGQVLLGVGAKILPTYSAGAAHRRALRNGGNGWAASRFRPAGDWDLAFALAGGPGSPCAGHAECSSALRCLAGACTVANTVRPSIDPATVSLAIGNAVTFTTTGGNAPYAYELVEGGGTLSGGAYVAPASAGTATVRVTDAFGYTSDAAITIEPALALSPATVTLAVNNVFAFETAGGVGPFSFEVATGGGSFSGASYTAPAASGTATVRVTDSLSNVAQAVVTINAALSISPASVTLPVSGSQLFAASNGVPPYVFSRAAGVGTVTDATYVAPGSGGTATVRVTDLRGNTADAAVTVRAPPPAPTITGTTPASPSATTTPTVNGTAQADALVKLYAGSCSGSTVATGTASGAGAFSIGVGPLSLGTTTTFYATATDALGQVSGCSTGRSYTTATPSTGSGSDGALNVTTNTTLAPASSLLGGAPTAGSTSLILVNGAGFTAGCKVLVRHVRHSSEAGAWTIADVASVSGNTLTLTSGLPIGFSDSANTQVARVYQYTDVTVAAGATLSATPWNSATKLGGVLAFVASGTVTVNGTLSMAGAGYAGGVSDSVDPGTTQWKQKGESFTGVGATANSTNVSNAGGGNGGSKRGGCEGGGGGGGGYGANGTAGGNYVGGCGTQPGGTFGTTYGDANLTSLLNGSGGGAGGYTVSALGAGGAGGGVILVQAPTITIANTGIVTANGAAGANEYSDYGGGGGGSGGAVLLKAVQLNVGASDRITAAGGAGGLATSGGSQAGGAGGVGRVRLDYGTLAVTGTGSTTGHLTTDSVLRAAANPDPGASAAFP